MNFKLLFLVVALQQSALVTGIPEVVAGEPPWNL
jgi:hypothetical protein